ncbi:MAG: hypothetical protein ABIG39_07010 [Candidatus Micrarchaeota archaeon]
MRLLVLLSMLLLVGTVYSENHTFNAYYFFSPTCLHCERIDSFVECEEKRFQDNLELIRLDITNEENAKIYRQLLVGYGAGIDRVSTPTLFIGDKMFVGDSPIANNFEEELLKCVEHGCINPIDMANGTVIDETNFQPDLLAITALAISDSVNPCAFAVLLFLLTYVSSIGSTKRAIKVAIVYIGVVFLSYLIAGLGISVLTDLLMPFRPVIVFLAGSFAVVAGAINIKDYFFYGKWFSLHIPKGYGPMIERYSKKSSLPGAAVLGLVVSAVELPCTGFAYFAAIGILTKYEMIDRIPWLVYYNIIFVIPLFAILALYFKGFSTEAMENWRDDKKRLMKLVLGVVLLVIGLVLILQSYAEIIASFVEIKDCKSLVFGL